VLAPDLFRPRGEVLADLTRHLDDLRNSGGRDGGTVRLPGDEAARTRSDNEAHGIGIPDSLAADLDQLSRELGVPSPFTKAETR
jgi:LDH2 family malate/lactate/ureidoglycolate dehydrogenase